MGQYYMMINKTKKEYIRLWDLGGSGTCIDWSLARTAGIFPYTLKKISRGDGEDIGLKNPKYAGRWAGDEVYLVDDYDKSKHYATAQSAYHNISKELAAEYDK